MVARQTGLIRGVLEFGVSYTTVLPSMRPPGAGEGEPGAYIRCLSPRQMTALYGEPVEWEPGVTPVDDDWPIMALEIKDKAIRLYDEEKVHFIGVQNVPESALGWRDPLYSGYGNFEYLESRRHDVGVCPVIRYRDRWLLNGEEQYGIIEPLINIQARVDETTYEMGATQYFTAFAQRWVAGWRPQDELQALTMAQGDVWYFSSKDVKVGQFDAGDVKGYIESKQSAVRDIASISQTPAQNLGVDALVNISEATLAGLEAGKDRKSAEIQTALGESFEQLLRTCAHITGDKDASMDYGAEVKWLDATARSFAQQVDGLVKLTTGLGLPDELAWEMVPGATKEWVERAIEIRDKQKEEIEAQMESAASASTGNTGYSTAGATRRRSSSMIRKLGLVLSAAAIATSALVACNKDDDKKPPDLTTVVQEPGGKCVGYETCPTPDDQHITAKLEPKEVTTSVEVPSTTLSPTVTEVPTVSPSETSVLVPTVTQTS